MKLAALLLLFAIVGKMSAAPAYRLAYYRAAPQQQLQEVEEDDDDAETEISQEDFSQDNIQDEIQDDDDDSDEQEAPPQFQKLFPLPGRTSPGHNFPLSIMMGEISAGGWNVPKNPVRTNQQQQQQRARQDIELADDDDDDDSDEDEEDEEEDDEPEDDLPDWQKLFPNLQDQGSGPPEGVIDQSSQPEIPAAYRSAIGGSRVVYIPARQLRRSPQMIRRPAVPQRSQVIYSMMPSSSPYIRRQPFVQSRPQYVLASNSMQSRPQYVLSSSSMQRRPQQSVYYMPVRRNTYNPYVSPYVPRYRYY